MVNILKAMCDLDLENDEFLDSVLVSIVDNF